MQCTRAEERVGTLLSGRYRLEGILGEGGQAVVYRATHAWTGRAVAVKLLRPEHARDRNLVMRFLREARTASTLVHPNVVAILDMGADEDGDVHLAMELVEGRSLGEILEREERLEPTRAITLLRPIVDALALAHRSGIVHRDIKPDNILIGDRGDGVVRPILLDFGTAKSTTTTWGNATQVGAIIGTPFYMSPEQTEGAADLGPASDVWSMGVLLYRCLSGSLPFFASSPSSLLLAIIRGEHEPLERIAPWVPAPIAAVVERALRTEREHRYANAGELLEALDRAMAGRIDDADAIASGAVRAVPARRRARRAIAAVATGATLALSLALGALFALGTPAAPVASGAGGGGATMPESVPAPTLLPNGIDPPVELAPQRAPDVARPSEATALISALPIARRTPIAAHADAPATGAALPAIGSAGPLAPSRGRALARSFDDRRADEDQRPLHGRIGLAREW